MTGILAARAGLRGRDHPGFTYTKRPVSRPCLYAQAVSSHGLEPAEMKRAADGVRGVVVGRGGCRKLPPIKLRGFRPKCKW